jgi:putative ATP-binding cassette transporter
MPAGKTVLFLPHRPYQPLGSLREALAYPAPPARFGDEALRAVLRRIRLERLAPALDEDVRWDRELSLDEQQRLAIGRALLHRPDWIIQDEAMSELDEDNRALVKSLLATELAGTGLIGIGKPGENGSFYGRTVHLLAAPSAADTDQAAEGGAAVQLRS